MVLTKVRKYQRGFSFTVWKSKICFTRTGEVKGLGQGVLGQKLAYRPV